MGVELAGLEQRLHQPGETFQVGMAGLVEIDERQVERHQRHIEPLPLGDEAVAGFEQQPLGLGHATAAVGDSALQPEEAES